MIFRNDTAYTQPVIPTPTRHLMDRSIVGQHLMMRTHDTHFKTIGWFEKGQVPDSRGQLSDKHANILADLIEKGPQFCWRGAMYGVANQYLFVSPYQDRYPRHVMPYFRDELVEFHANRVSMVRGSDNVVWVFPQSLIYWIARGYNPPSEFQHAILHGKPVLHNELVFHPFSEKQDGFGFYEEWQAFDVERTKFDYDSPRPSEMFDLPRRYQGNYPARLITLPMWVNFGAGFEDGEYVHQSFEVPFPHDTTDIHAILGRQSLITLALAHMAQGYGKLAAVSESHPKLGEALKEAFLEPHIVDELDAYIHQRHGWQNMPDKLRTLGQTYFPYQEELDEQN
ncbi:hypothetical protein QTP81_04210 [Alteromonas sp. ASW11-36]|uniref:DUF1838 domain-containing protein n=1 Tax=Alteromonas arenosi TaxID=3055817 RepID=A0ABT7SUD9_9ALTE|nr:hypothetical protein [Alteromonas sp. ASW11-36]MDM7859803.1 hypothetical protein [Alteromonas sp. ASW11-36]